MWLASAPRRRLSHFSSSSRPDTVPPPPTNMRIRTARLIVAVIAAAAPATAFLDGLTQTTKNNKNRQQAPVVRPLKPKLDPVIKVEPPTKNVDLWAQLVPGITDDPRGIDKAMTWNAFYQKPGSVTADFMDRIEYAYGKKLRGRQVLQDHLQQSIETFTTYCMEQLGVDEIAGRLVATRGPIGSEELFFREHDVPIQWNQAFVGPGCIYVNGNDVQWDNMPILRDTSKTVRERNNALLKRFAKVHRVPEGDAVMIRGRRWNDVGIRPSEPVLVRCPDPPMPWQGRVVLMMVPVVPRKVTPLPK